MKKILLVGRSECGKTTLTQALRGETIHYHKTQYVNHFDVIIDTPGEYAENKFLGRALALYSYEADVVGLLLSATEPYSLLSPCVAASAQPGGHRHRHPNRSAPRQPRAGGGLAAAGEVRDSVSCQRRQRGRRLADPRISRQRGTFCRGTTREPGEPADGRVLFSAIQHIYYGNADNPCGFYQSFQGDPCMILQFPC